MFGLLNEFSEFGETLIYSKFTLRKSGEAVSHVCSAFPQEFWILNFKEFFEMSEVLF